MSEKNEYINCWLQFDRSEDRNIAMCRQCKTQISCKWSTTTGLHRHLASKHGMQNVSRSENLNPKRMRIGSPISTSGNQNIDNFLIKNRTQTQSLGEIISKLAAIDNIPILKISNCEFIRNSLKLQGFILPKYPTDIMNIIYKYYDQIKKDIVSNTINIMKKKQ